MNFSRFTRRWAAIVGAIVLGAATTACTEHRRPPVAAMVPQSTNGLFGYSDKIVAPDVYEVTYVSPGLRATQDADDAHGLCRREAARSMIWRCGAPPSWRRSKSSSLPGPGTRAATSTSRCATIPSTTRRRSLCGPCRWDCGWPGYWPYYPYDYSYRTSGGRAHYSEPDGQDAGSSNDGFSGHSGDPRASAARPTVRPPSR